ncbi:D-aminopeptidase [Streptomyces sp. RB5]|uniref:D-aminopeptidase n=1 Tax=Streptomyces smaragdinus TaxID=2585196 RepID=A0A7K0CML5_9ACTN|nr:serine hydrolase domain-containing protein [Streptomyces smaragdinus]MQY14282.1 D-aminopeptidase [Streptomyces smaragdinus]
MSLLPATRRALLHRLATAQAQGRTPSLAAAVVRDGETVWTGSRSMLGDGHAPDAGTQYRIGSITKTFVAVLVMRLRDEGLIDLADPLDTHLKGTQAGSATIHQLLTHTAGLGAEPRGPWWERTPGSLRPDIAALYDESAQTVLEPGRRHHYSNPGFAYLGALVEQVRGAAWGDVLTDEVLEPLGMTRTTLLPEAPHAGGFAVHPWADVMLPEPLTDTGAMGPAGQLWSTTGDLARFAAFLAEGADGVLGADTLEEMRTPAAPPAFGSWDAGQGLGVQLSRTPDGRIIAGHSGSMPGFLASLHLSVEEGLASVVLTNVTSGMTTTAVANDLIRLVAEHEPRFPDPWRPLDADAVDPALLDLTGPWYWGANPFALHLKADRRLQLTPLGAAGRASRFRPEADGTWTGLDGYYTGETLRVRRGADGEVTHLDLATFVLTRKPYDPKAPVPGGSDGWTPAS